MDCTIFQRWENGPVQRELAPGSDFKKRKNKLEYGWGHRRLKKSGERITNTQSKKMFSRWEIKFEEEGGGRDARKKQSRSMGGVVKTNDISVWARRTNEEEVYKDHGIKRLGGTRKNKNHVVADQRTIGKKRMLAKKLGGGGKKGEKRRRKAE